MEIDKLALELATKYHQGQFRHDKKTPYVEHPKAVAAQFTDPRYKAVAYLHDVLEDCNVDAITLRAEGIPVEIVDSVLALTKREKDRYLDYILRVCKDPMARAVKIEDIRHNSKTTPEGSRKDKYDLALHILHTSG